MQDDSSRLPTLLWITIALGFVALIAAVNLASRLAEGQ